MSWRSPSPDGVCFGITKIPSHPPPRLNSSGAGAARPAVVCDLEPGTTNLCWSALWVTRGRSPNEQGGLTSLCSQTKAKDSKIEKLSISLWRRLSAWPLFEVSLVLVSSSGRDVATISHGHHVPAGYALRGSSDWVHTGSCAHCGVVTVAGCCECQP